MGGVVHWFLRCSLTFYITFESNVKSMLTKITILSDFSESNNYKIENS